MTHEPKHRNAGKENPEEKKKKRRLFIFFFLLFLGGLALTPMIDWFGRKPAAPSSAASAKTSVKKTVSAPIRRTTFVSQPTTPLLVPPGADITLHIGKILNYIYKHIHPDTYLSYSLPGDKRLRYWSVTYDNAMRTIAHIRTGDIASARKTIDYFMTNTAIQKIGYVYKNGKLVRRPGWTINIVDGAEGRIGGRGIEHIAHVGPNVYLGIAALHLHQATKDPKYLAYARNRWLLIKDLQNENPKDFNYGGVRMGPMGDPNNPQEQKLEFKAENPSFYEFYNGEHAADFLALTNLLAKIDIANKKEYDRAAHLISIWDKKIYDRDRHLFLIGTCEKRYFDINIGQWVGPGVIPMRPLDTTALKICAYGVKGLEQFEVNGAEKMRAAMDRHFKVTVNTKIDGKMVTATGYDFIADLDRKNLILYEEEGPLGDVKVKKGVGRKPLLSDEWSTWVAFSDLRMAKDFRRMGQKKKSVQYLNAYKANALGEALKTGDPIDANTIAYPYAHPMGEGFNKPVGFGWNTAHEPYSIIGGVARIMGILGADPFSLDGQALTYRADPRSYRLAVRSKRGVGEGLVTEAELYINEAWKYVRIAERRDSREEENWVKAAATIERMTIDHPDWLTIAETQNNLAKNSGEGFPLMGMGGVTIEELEPIYRRYWALYHVGTGEFIRVMAYSELAHLAKSQKDSVRQVEYEKKARYFAQRIIDKFYYAQAYDKTGWLWQPAVSLREYVEDLDESSVTHT